MPIVLFNHGNTGTEMFGEVLYRHPAVCQRRGCIVIPKAAPGAPLAISRTGYRLVKPFISCLIR